MEILILLLIFIIIIILLSKKSGSAEYNINIQNPSDTPWLDYIISGIKKYEGRLNKGKFSNMRVGDKIIFMNNGRSIETIIVGLKYYKDFIEAYEDLGEKLVPNFPCMRGKDKKKEVKRLYNLYFNDEDIKKYGIVAIKIKV